MTGAWWMFDQHWESIVWTNSFDLGNSLHSVLFGQQEFPELR
jgi:hypothetical protein